VSLVLDYGSTTAMQRWLIFWQTCWVVFRPCLMLLPGQSPVFHAQRTSPRHSLVYTGFVGLSVSSSSWRCWLIVVYTAQPPRYLSAQLTRVTDIPSRRRLRSSATDALLLSPTRLVTVNDQAFPVAAAKL